jgi:hypothetical protein
MIEGYSLLNIVGIAGVAGLILNAIPQLRNLNSDWKQIINVGVCLILAGIGLVFFVSPITATAIYQAIVIGLLASFTETAGYEAVKRVIGVSAPK